jgi:hypothetical protein
MVLRLVEGNGFKKDWVSYEEISPNLPRAAIAAEDAGFCAHYGFEWEAIQNAWNRNQRSRRIRGGSTISNQTAKNAFLWPDRTYVRKGLEYYFTGLVELMWGKKRILEVYLNVVEFGPEDWPAREYTADELRAFAALSTAGASEPVAQWQIWVEDVIGPDGWVNEDAEMIEHWRSKGRKVRPFFASPPSDFADGSPSMASRCSTRDTGFFSARYASFRYDERSRLASRSDGVAL